MKKEKQKPIVEPCSKCGRKFDSKYQAKQHICPSNSIMGMALQKAGAI